VTGTLVVDCDAINEQSGNVLLNIIDQGTAIEIDTSVSQEDNVLTANATGVSYQWVDCNNGNAPIEGETNQSFTAMSNGSYAVIITDSNCPDDPVMSTCYEVTSVGLAKLDQTVEVTIYPNPASSLVSIEIELESTAKVQVKIFNAVGMLIEDLGESNNLSTMIKYDVSNLPSGLYWVSFEFEGSIHVQKLLVD